MNLHGEKPWVIDQLSNNEGFSGGHSPLWGAVWATSAILWVTEIICPYFPELLLRELLVYHWREEHWSVGSESWPMSAILNTLSVWWLHVGLPWVVLACDEWNQAGLVRHHGFRSLGLWLEIRFPHLYSPPIYINFSLIVIFCSL